MRDQGVEVAVMAVNINDGSCAHFGSPLGDSFFIEQKSLTANFANFCKHNSKLKMISLYLYPYTESQILQYAKYNKLINIPKFL